MSGLPEPARGERAVELERAALSSARDMLAEKRALLERDVAKSRELSLALTKIDEACMWLERVPRRPFPERPA